MSVYKDKRTGHWGYNFMYKGGRYHRLFPEAKTKNEVEGYEQIARANLRQKAYGIIEKLKPNLIELIKDYNDYQEVAYTRPHEFDYVINHFYKMTGNKMADEIILNKSDIRNPVFMPMQNNNRSRVPLSFNMDLISSIFCLFLIG